MKKLFFAGSFALTMLVAACDKDDDNDNSNQTNTTDQTFMTNVAIGNMAELQLGQLAATKGTNAMVRTYGQLMTAEHTQAQTDLQATANTAGYRLPDSVDAAHQAIRNMLMSMPAGRSWDTAYINSQVRDHQNTLNIFQMEVSSGQHTQAKNYANTYLPHIQMHLSKADSISRVL